MTIRCVHTRTVTSFASPNGFFVHPLFNKRVYILKLYDFSGFALMVINCSATCRKVMHANYFSKTLRNHLDKRRPTPCHNQYQPSKCSKQTLFPSWHCSIASSLYSVWPVYARQTIKQGLPGRPNSPGDFLLCHH